MQPSEYNQKRLQAIRESEAKTLHRKMRRLGAPTDAGGYLVHHASKLASPAMEIVRECLAIGAEVGRNSWDTATLEVYLNDQSEIASKFARHLLSISGSFMQNGGPSAFTDVLKTRNGKVEIGPRGREFLISVYSQSLSCANTSQLVAWLARMLDSQYNRLGKQGAVGLYQLINHITLQVKLLGQWYDDESVASADAMRYTVAEKRARLQMTQHWHAMTRSIGPADRRPLSGTVPTTKGHKAEMREKRAKDLHRNRK